MLLVLAVIIAVIVLLSFNSRHTIENKYYSYSDVKKEYGELARLEGIREASVKANIKRAKKARRERLERERVERLEKSGIKHEFVFDGLYMRYVCINCQTICKKITLISKKQTINDLPYNCCPKIDLEI